jgi:hypothetical protein
MYLCHINKNDINYKAVSRKIIGFFYAKNIRVGSIPFTSNNKREVTKVLSTGIS